MVSRYQKWTSCPQLDRIDIHSEVARLDYECSSGDRLEEAPADGRELRVILFGGTRMPLPVGIRCECPGIYA